MLPLRIAARFLKSNKTQTILIVLGIAIGVSVQVFVGSLIQSLQEDLVERTVGGSPQITIRGEEGSIMIDDWPRIVTAAESTAGVTVVSYSADSPALLNEGLQPDNILLRGWDMERAAAIYGIKDAIYDGQPPTGQKQVMLGREMAEKYDLSPGDNVSIIIAGAPPADFIISGLYDLRIATVNRLWVITNIQTAQNVLGYGNGVTSVEMKVDDVFMADVISQDLEKSLNNNTLAITNWKEDNAELLTGLQAQSASSFIIQAFVLISMVIAISSILAITVMQKSRQIGILKAMGIKNRQASKIFLYQGLLLGLGGAALGVALAASMLYGFTNFGPSSEGERLFTITLDPVFVSTSFIIAVLASAVASVLPARKSSKLDPIEVIRNG